MKRKSTVRTLTTAAMMGAVAFVLMYMSIPTPLSPFAELDFSALPELIGGFVLGPIGALEIITVKILLKIVFKGTSSMYTGELQAFLLSVSYVLPAVLYYQNHKSKRGAVIGLIIGGISSIIVAIITNLYLIFPFYMYLYGMSWDAIIGMCSALIPAIHDKLTIVIFSIVPFNLLSRSLTAVIAILVYKKLSVPLKKIAAQ
ncbi:MAG: ECF transporter S component [Clostridia bacterium]|nr:ECF transporter S component [Clostridia bacterium]